MNWCLASGDLASVKMRPTLKAFLVLCLFLVGCGTTPKCINQTSKVKIGTPIWEFETGGAVGSSPAIGIDGTVYVGSGFEMEKKIFALDGSTGAKKWDFKPRNSRADSGDMQSSPAIGADGTVYIGSADHYVYALDGETGVKKWEFQTGNDVRSSPAVGTDGTVYVGSTDRKVYALDGKTGAKKWQFNAEHWVDSSPSIDAKGTIYVGVQFLAYALDGKKGIKKWEFTDIPSFSDANPAIGADGITYWVSWDYIIALKRSNATRDGFIGQGIYRDRMWQLELNARRSSPAIGTDGTVYIGSDEKVYALDGTTGLKKWEFETGGWVRSSPAIGSDGTVYIGSDDNKIYALDGKTGVKRWEFVTGGLVRSSPVIGADGTVYIGSNDGKIYALRSSSSGPDKSPWPMFRQNAQHTGRVMEK